MVTGKLVKRRKSQESHQSASSSRASRGESEAAPSTASKQSSQPSLKPAKEKLAGKQKDLSAFFTSTTPSNKPEQPPPATATPSSAALPLSAGPEQQRRHQLRIAAKRVQKAVKDFSPKQMNKFARQAVKELVPLGNYTLPSAGVLGIEPFIHHVLRRELAKRRELASSKQAGLEPSAENEKEGEKAEPEKKRRKKVAGEDEESFKFDRLLNQFMSGVSILGIL